MKAIGQDWILDRTAEESEIPRKYACYILIGQLSHERYLHL